MCLPVSGNEVWVLWSNFPSVQVIVSWHVEQIAGVKAGLRVRRRVRGVVLGHVTAGASGGRVRVVAAGVALRALQVCMPVGQREELIVVERRCVPACRCMARGAGGSRKSRLRVRRVVRAVVIGHVARRAVRRRAHVLVVDMALRTRLRSRACRPAGIRSCCDRTWRRAR